MNRKELALNRRDLAVNKLQSLGEKIIEDVNLMNVPSIQVPSRGTSNIVYDDDKRYYVLGDRYGQRSLGNVKQIKKIGQMVYMANFCKSLVQSGKTATLREMYYVSEGWDIDFGDQQESNIIGEDLEVTLGISREDLGLMPEEDGASVYGNITVKDDDVEINALKMGKSGYTISPTIDEVELVDHDVQRVIAVETMGMFHRMVQEKAFKKFDTLSSGTQRTSRPCNS